MSIEGGQRSLVVKSSIEGSNRESRSWWPPRRPPGRRFPSTNSRGTGETAARQSRIDSGHTLGVPETRGFFRGDDKRFARTGVLVRSGCREGPMRELVTVASVSVGRGAPAFRV